MHIPQEPLASPTEASGGFVDAVRDLAPLDLVGLGLIAILVGLGIWRGLWWQVIRLAGVLFAVVLARSFAGDLGTRIHGLWPELSTRLAFGVAWFGVFVVAMTVAAAVGLLGNKLLDILHLGLANRLGGGAVGAATGLALHAAALAILCQLAPEPFVGRVVAGTFSEKLVDAVGQRVHVLVDGQAAREIQRLLDPGWTELRTAPDAAPQGQPNSTSPVESR